MTEALDHLARRAADRPAYLASALADFSRSEGLGDEALARELGCEVATLTPLRLCLRPRADAAWFRRDVEEISNRFGVAPQILARVVRRADALARLRRPAANDQGFLMAARDREDGDQPETGPDKR